MTTMTTMTDDTLIYLARTGGDALYARDDEGGLTSRLREPGNYQLTTVGALLGSVPVRLRDRIRGIIAAAAKSDQHPRSYASYGAAVYEYGSAAGLPTDAIAIIVPADQDQARRDLDGIEAAAIRSREILARSIAELAVASRAAQEVSGAGWFEAAARTHRAAGAGAK